jgi:MoxR-like ATPase
MGKKVHDFKNFVLNEYNTNENFLADKLSKLADWAKKLVKSIGDGLVKKIPSGDKQGAPMMGYFDPALGSIQDQIKKHYAGTKFATTNPMEMYESVQMDESEIEEARLPLSYTGEDQTVRNVNSTELITMIKKLYRAKSRGDIAIPIFIFGAPGIGKTQIVGQAAEEMGVPMLPLDLQFMAPEDFIGIPKNVDIVEPDVEKFKETGERKYLGTGVTRSNPPIGTKLPLNNGPEDKGGIMFLDEFNRADKIVLNSLMQFVQQGRIDDYNLPSKWIIVAAGNRPSEADVTDFDFALADRFVIVNYEPQVKDWAEWAKTKGKVLPEVIDFVQRNEELFHFLDTEKETKKFPTPRSWTSAAKTLQAEINDEGVETWRDLPMDVVINIFQDQIGPMAAGKLKSYLEVIRRISESDLEAMVKDPEKARLLPKEQATANVLYGMYEMAVRKAEEMSEKGEASTEDLYNIMKYFERYDELEKLAWIYKRIIEKYPEFAVTEDTVNNESLPENVMKIAASEMIFSRGIKKGLIK